MEYEVEWCDSNGIKWIQFIPGTFEDACAFAVAPPESDSKWARVFLDDVEVWSYDRKAL